MATGRRPASGGGRWLVPTVLLFVVVPLAIAVTTALGGGDGGGDATSSTLPRRGSTVVADAGAGEPLRIRRTPESYEITYRVTTAGTPDPTVSTEQLQVRRPFHGRVAIAQPAGGTSIRATRLGALIIPTGAGARRLSVPPAMAGSDLRFDGTVATALAEGRIVAREQRRVADRRCQVYRFGGSITAGDLTTYDPEGSEWADACIDEDGLLLEELWHKGGRQLRHRVATDVAVDGPLADDLFLLDGETSIPVAEGNGVFRRLAPDSAVEGPTLTIRPPAGFEPLGRFAVQAPRLDLEQSPLQDTLPESFDQIDVWQRGPDLLVLANTISADAATADPTKGEPIDLGPLGQGRIEVSLRGAIIHAPTVAGRTPRLSGTLPPGELAALLQAATTIEGTGLRFADDT